MSRPKMYQPPRPTRPIDEPRCAYGCGEHGSYGFAGNVRYAFGHWPAELAPGGRPSVEAPAPPPRKEAGAPVQGELFSLTNPASRRSSGPPGSRGRGTA